MDQADSLGELESLGERVGVLLAQRGWRLATAESCTGGWIAQAITSVPGSSGWFDRGFITYSNASKVEMLGVQAETLARHGAVSEATVLEMTRGVLARSHADVAVAVSGIAGPGGATADKAVGTVALAWARRGGAATSAIVHLAGNRAEVRRAAVAAALRGLLERFGVDVA